MIKLLTYIFILMLLSIPIIAQDACKVDVNIEVNKDSSLIFFDGVQIGKGSLTAQLEVGKHEIVIMQSSKEWGSDVITDSITISDCGFPLNLHYNFEQKTLLTSSPDAAVFHNDSLLGYTPIQIPLKFSTLSLKKNGYSAENILLSKVPVQRKIRLDYIGNEKDKPFIKTTLFKVLVGSAIALGATTAYLKLEADKKFDQYLETRNNKYLDDTDQFDLFSGIAFGVLQINFGALLYFFLTE